MAIFRHVTSGIHWKIFVTVFLRFIAGKCHGSVNIYNFLPVIIKKIYSIVSSGCHIDVCTWQHISYKLLLDDLLFQSLILLLEGNLGTSKYLYIRYALRANLICCPLNKVLLLDKHSNSRFFSVNIQKHIKRLKYYFHESFIQQSNRI